MAKRAEAIIETPPDDVIDARPTKRFFVRMLVRDIELVPAVIDLIDNSVDGAKRLAAESGKRAKSKRPSGSRTVKPSTGIKLSGHTIDIRLDGDGFAIEDNCGGIELKRALEYAFRFGRPDDVEPVEGEVGQFGVGMKRALFKLGQHFEVESVASKSSFKVSADVPKWLDDQDDWSFPLEYANKGERNPRKDLGTKVTVSDLLPSVADEFKEDRFLQRLRAQIELSHQEALASGMVVRLNGHKLRSRPPVLLSSDSVKPRVLSKKLKDGDAQVKMNLFAGFAKLQDEGADTDDPDQFSGHSLAGWYVICNGRMLVFADKTRLTGWGAEVADYHPQYRRFRGYVYLTGDSAAMPWNTAKTAVDEDSTIWREVRKEIIAALREARTAMNKVKREIQGEGAKESPMATKLDAAKGTPLAELSKSTTLVLSSGSKAGSKKSAQRVDFQVPIDRFDEVAESFGLSQPAAVGKRIFDYYYEREILD